MIKVNSMLKKKKRRTYLYAQLMKDRLLLVATRMLQGAINLYVPITDDAYVIVQKVALRHFELFCEQQRQRVNL